MPDGVPTTTANPPQPLNFDHIPGHQLHDDSSIGPASADESRTSQEIHSLGMIPYTEPEELQRALEHVTSAIENYTQEGRAQHPVLSKLGDAIRAAKELLTGGKSAGQPMGTEYGVVNNPVTQAISIVPGAAEDAAKAETALREYGPKVAEHIADIGRDFRADFHAYKNARAPEGSREAGRIPLGKPRLNFDDIPGHQDINPYPNRPQKVETVSVPPKSFINKVSRGRISPEVVNAKRAQIRNGETLEPAKIFYDAQGNVVGADGRHRALAHMQEGTERMPVEIHRELPETKGNPQVAESAQRYNTSRGQQPIDHAPLALPEQKEKNALADAYDAAKHEPENPKVQAAYQAMKDETKSQYNHMVNDLGIKVDFTSKDPYTNAEEMQKDVRDNHHLSVYTGGEVPKDHPMAEIDKDTGQSYNNLFRATHDVFGHAAGGNDFSEAGEHAAYGAHKQMYSPEAVPAVRTETQGQSNWFFNNREVRNGKPLGDFPEQKATILPEQGEAKQVSPAAPTEVNNAQQQAVEAAGGVYRGQNKDGLVEITLPESMTKDLSISEPLKKFVSVTMPADEVTPESVKAAMDRKLAEFGGKTPTGDITESQRTATGYHPDLQKMAEHFPPTNNAAETRAGATFITPDGKFLPLGAEEHPYAIQLVNPKYDEINPKDNRVPFINDTGAVRTSFRKEKAGDTLAVTVPKSGVTPEQVESIKQGVGKLGRYGNLIIERADITPETKDALVRRKEFARPGDVDSMLHEIGAHPEHWTRKTETMMQESPAGAINPRTGESDKTGFGVEIYPEARANREPLDHLPTREDIDNFYQKNKEIFDRHPELRVGWDKTDKGWELNIGAAGPTQAGAELVGRKLGQRAAWNIEKGQEVPTGGTGEKTKFGQYNLEDRINDLTGRNVAKLPPTIRYSEHLTDEEKHLLGSSDTALRDFKNIRKKIASVQDLRETMKAGEANRFWYDRAKKAFDAMFDSLPQGSYPPEDRNKFISLVAATSPRVDVTENIASALNAYRAWTEEGRPTNPQTIREVIDSSLMMPGGHGPNAARALTGQPLSGPKVTSFNKNFMGSAKHVTNDMWGAITNGIVNPNEITSPGAYIALSENYRKAAAELGWTPQQGQAASWGFIRTLGNISGLGGQMAGKDRPATELIKMIDDPLVQKYSADIAQIFLTNPKVRERLEALGVNLNDFDTKLNKSIEPFGRTSTEQTGRPDTRSLTRTAKRVEKAKEFAHSQAAQGKRVNEKAAPLFEKSQLPARANPKIGQKSTISGVPLEWLNIKKSSR